ncbi:MAG: sulfatase [Thermoplasmata archaeon]
MQAGNAPSRPPNVVTIVLDCARAKNFSMSGGDRLAETPIIDSLASRGTVFPRAVAPANWTLPSHFSIFTGTYPNVHGMRTFQERAAPLVTTAASMRKAGYDTGMFTENVYLVGGVGLEDGFDVQRSPKAGISEEEKTFVNGLIGRARFLYSARARKLFSRLPPLIAPLSFLFHSQEVAFKEDVCDERTVARFGEWLSGKSPARPFYAFLNFVDTHDPYDLVLGGEKLGFLDRAYLYAPRYYLLAVPGLQSLLHWSALVGGYVKSIEAADRKVGQLLSVLEAHGESDRTMLVITSDHGQSFGEGGNAFHGCGATDSVTRVPLVVVPPAGVKVPRRVERWVSLCEIDSWIKSAAAGLAPYDEEGRTSAVGATADQYSGVVYAEGGPVSDPIRSLRGIREDQSWNHRLLAAYRGDEKFLLDLETSEVFRWEAEGDPDLSAPARLSAEAAATVRREVFGPYEAQEAARIALTSGAPTPAELEIDQRLRLWGYD